MGLFSFIGKALGKVAKIGVGVAGAGINSLTHGASGKLIKIIKGRGPSAPSGAQTAALIAKVGTPTPKLSSTEQRTEGWGFSPDGYGADRETKRTRAYGKPKRRPPVHVTSSPLGDDVAAAYRAQGRRVVRSLKTGTKTRRSPAKPRTGRKPPPGGLDLKALSVAWRKAGSPGSWQGWIKAQGANFRKT